MSDEKWYTLLPECPCKNPDWTSPEVEDGWGRDIGDIDKYHTGATVCFRSYPAVKTNQGMSGQQCCYDQNGNLITGGSGAGTPDKVSTCKGEDETGTMEVDYSGGIGHWLKDVIPWDKAGGKGEGWKEYNQHWPPSSNADCPPNIVSTD